MGMKQNKFKLIVPSYNNEQWVEYNLASILNQTYQNFEVVYINDASDDNTLEKVNSIVGNNKKFNIINNKTNKGAAYNYVEFVDKFVDDEDIIVHLDGDDWLIDEHVLYKLNQTYIENDYWMTYGQFLVFDGNEYRKSNPQGTAHSDYVHQFKLYRRDDWRASHLRTYKGKLFKAISKDDLKDLSDKQYYWHASDLAWAFPALEMCPKEKIGVLDFYSHVYNQTPSNQVRTAEREDSSNNIYELEIRNRKHYKEGLSGEKLPQVNAFGDYRERHTIPREFSYVYNLEQGEFDLTILQDDSIVNYLNGSVKVDDSKPIVAIVAEGPHLFTQPRVYDAVIKHHNKFNLVLGWHESLHHLPNFKFKPITEISQWNMLPELLDTSKFKIYDKNKLVSFVSSNKNISTSHQYRLDCLNSVKEKFNHVDLFGRGINPIQSKLDGLRDYRFSVVMENGYFDHYFTEKLIDSFLCGTIPIYHGAKNVGEYFDLNGILEFETKDELFKHIENLSPDLYESKIQAVQNNFELALNWWEDNDRLFNKYLKDVI